MKPWEIKLTPKHKQAFIQIAAQLRQGGQANCPHAEGVYEAEKEGMCQELCIKLFPTLLSHKGPLARKGWTPCPCYHISLRHKIDVVGKLLKYNIEV